MTGGVEPSFTLANYFFVMSVCGAIFIFMDQQKSFLSIIIGWAFGFALLNIHDNNSLRVVQDLSNN